MTVALRLLLDGRQFDTGFRGAGRSRQRFVDDTRRDFGGLNRLMRDTRTQLAGLGIGFGVVATGAKSAQLDKSLIRIGQTADATREQVVGLRRELFSMSRETGQQVENLAGGFDVLIQKGLAYKQALASISAINRASAVTGAAPGTLAEALFVGGSTFNFDLSNPATAVSLLDQMYAAAKSGSAELEQLSSIFGVVGGKAKDAGMSFKDTLAFVETLSLTTPAARLETLADSTLRLFTNINYLKTASKALKNQGLFFDNQGARRNPAEILAEILASYKKQPTDKARLDFFGKAFSSTDLDTQTGLRKLLDEGSLKDMANIARSLDQAGGSIERNLPGAIDNAVDQANRLKTTMRQVGDEFAQPVNKALADLLNYGLNRQDKGGLGLSPGQTAAWSIGGVVVAGAVASGVTALVSMLPGALGKILGGGVSTAAGLAQGQLVEKAGLGTAVFVTNWPGSLGGGGAGDALGGAAAALGGGAVLKGLPATMRLLKSASVLSLLSGSLGAGGVAAALGGVGVAGAAGYGAGTLAYKGLFEGNAIGDAIGEAIARSLAGLGNDNAAAALASNASPLKGELTIRIDQDGRARVGAITAKGGLDLNVATGMRIFGATP